MDAGRPHPDSGRRDKHRGEQGAEQAQRHTSPSVRARRLVRGIPPSGQAPGIAPKVSFTSARPTEAGEPGHEAVLTVTPPPGWAGRELLPFPAEPTGAAAAPVRWT